MANKKHEANTNTNDKEGEMKSETKTEKSGIENKAFDTNEGFKNKNQTKTDTSDISNNDVTQSQIEMGLTQSMMCNRTNNLWTGTSLTY